MARAEVGDDVFGEDPSIKESFGASLVGQPAALFAPSGTMGNQIALLCHCNRGDDVLVGEGSTACSTRLVVGQRLPVCSLQRWGMAVIIRRRKLARP